MTERKSNSGTALGWHWWIQTAKPFRGSSEVKAFLSKEIRAIVLKECGDDLMVIRIRYDLRVDDQGRLVVIYHVIAR